MPSELSGYLSTNSLKRSSPGASGFKLAYYPFSLILFLLWAAFTAALITLLELSAQAAPTAIQQKWYYGWLPTVLLTVFAQGHVAITGMYLGRLAMSTIQMCSRSPASWAELFWQANRSWQGPIGILSMMYVKIKMRAPVSFTILLFATTCIIATGTPVVLSKAYPLTTINVDTNITRELKVFWPGQMVSIDFYAQLAAGGGAWATGGSALSIYNSSVYIPAGTPRVDSQVNDVFFTGDTLGADARLSGVRTNGTCRTVSSGPISYDNFLSDMCAPLSATPTSGISTSTWWSTNNSLWWCTTLPTIFSILMNSSDSSIYATALLWLDINNGSLHNSSNSSQTPQPEAVQGVIMCNATFSTGWATLNGLDRTFVDFQEAPLYDAAHAQQGEALRHPLNTALHALDNSDDYVKFGPPSMASMLGYNSTAQKNDLVWDLPSLDQMAQRVWQGTMHMGVAIGLLSQQSGHLYPVTIHTAIAGRKKNIVLAMVSWALAIVWFLILAGCTFAFFTPTFGDSLDAYTAARLLVENPALVDGHCCGSLEDNINLTTQFDAVGDSKMTEIVGHVTPGGAGVLRRGREYE